jgi:pteridine reductase
MQSDSTFPLVFITGSAQRIGKSLAEHLAANGWSVAIHCNRSRESALELAGNLSALYPEQSFRVFRADLSVTTEVENLLPAVIEKMGKPGLLVNNASVFEPGTLSQTTPDFLEGLLRINFHAPFRLMRDFHRLCGTGTIVNFADTRITSNRSGFAAYSLSKKLLWELTKMAALEFGPDIRVNAIAPGLAIPPADRDDSYMQELARTIPMKRPGGLKPILDSLDFILNNDYLTGQILFCDGGENLGRNF